MEKECDGCKSLCSALWLLHSRSSTYYLHDHWPGSMADAVLRIGCIFGMIDWVVNQAITVSPPYVHSREALPRGDSNCVAKKTFHCWFQLMPRAV